MHKKQILIYNQQLSVIQRKHTKIYYFDNGVAAYFRDKVISLPFRFNLRDNGRQHWDCPWRKKKSCVHSGPCAVTEWRHNCDKERNQSWLP